MPDKVSRDKISRDKISPASSSNTSGFNRRAFMAAAAGTAVAVPLTARGAEAPASPPASQDASLPVSVTLRVNGESKPLSLDVRTTVLDALREHLGLTGSKKGCDHGQCGACTVLIDNRRVVSCLTLAIAAQDKNITTIEGLARRDDSRDNNGGQLHPMQQAFIDQDAFQCGYCTPGQIMSAVACIEEGHANSDDDIREYMSGNICRCAAYPNIVAAVKQVAASTQKG
jgi:xanthine dehydrogenase YagT iron-sulfur-binding subunit